MPQQTNGMEARQNNVRSANRAHPAGPSPAQVPERHINLDICVRSTGSERFAFMFQTYAAVPSESLEFLHAISFFKTCFLRWPSVHKEQPRIQKSNFVTLIGMSTSAVPFADRGFRLGQTRRNDKRRGSLPVGLQYGRLPRAPPSYRLSCEELVQKRGAGSSELRVTFAFHMTLCSANITDNVIFRCGGQVGLKLCCMTS
jgi:hypothetical protein